MRLRIRGARSRPGRRSAALVGLLALALAAPVATTATTDTTATSARRPTASADGIRQYQVRMHSDSNSRTALQQSGVTVDDAVIERETSRNRDAVLQLLENADCMYRSIGKEAQYCA